MSLSKKLNCKSCESPLYWQDLETINWVNDHQDYVFICSECDTENIIQTRLFRDGHITKIYFDVLKDEKDRNCFPSEQLQKISEHLEHCNQCSEKLNEAILNEIEEKVKFNEKSYRYFIRKSNNIFKDLENTITTEDGHIEKFSYGGKDYTVNKDDEFFRETTNTVRKICYYLKIENCTIGMVSFIFSGEKIILEKIWFRPTEIINKQRKLFQDIKEGKVKIRLDTLYKIFKTLHD